ncbi:transcriptional regulator GlxA family with amidase domain [Dysgonomonas sp. PH5-45]|uniref:GlxA family transcriptional regulator n=1 Tax=unclassified Dysgonomonas TaxID=2630389 RepID=UPI00247693E9|nr:MULTISPECIES: GlxA family transcriptional regulator [unclassified Dysgonomonas]MDH6354353.1 transcriptional regulator GlxA family with amidase domain [Dysgonomonas sp. PH5-45]MDH6387253.1 transcriptional regulator GlxA family with amidase domain [Dysgonomonas sp. PH5-37]
MTLIHPKLPYGFFIIIFKANYTIMATRKIKHIVFLALPNATLLDITGPCEVFSQALELLHSRKEKPEFTYELHTLSTSSKKDIDTASDITIRCKESIKSVTYPIDTLFVPGVPNSQIEQYKLSQNVLRWINDQSKIVRRICSVCTGSFFLAEARVLSGRKVTTHWEKCNLLNSSFPDIEVDENPIFVKDGNIYTSAGISSGMDLALALVEEDYGKPFALEIARQMVLFLKRPGSQSQYSSILTHQHTDHQPIQAICNWILEHLQEVMTIEDLAERISMSPRNFARVFVRETGITPAKYIDKLRIETACRYLADTRLSLKEIATLCGLGSPDNMRKVFAKHIKISPAEYRRNFGTSLPVEI